MGRSRVRLRGPAFGRPPKLVDRGFRMAAGVPLTRGSEAKVAARTLRPGEARNRGPDSAPESSAPETLPDAEPPPTSEKHPRPFGPLVRPRDITRFPAVTYADHDIRKAPFGPLVRPRDITRFPAVTYADHGSLRGPKNQEPRETLSDPGPGASHWPAHALATDCSGSGIRSARGRTDGGRSGSTFPAGKGRKSLTRRVAAGC